MGNLQKAMSLNPITQRKSLRQIQKFLGLFCVYGEEKIMNVYSKKETVTIHHKREFE